MLMHSALRGLGLRRAVGMRGRYTAITAAGALCGTYAGYVRCVSVVGALGDGLSLVSGSLGPGKGMMRVYVSGAK